MTRLNVLKLVYLGHSPQLGHHFDIFVDNQQLLTLLSDFEHQYDPIINGAYVSAINQQALNSNLTSWGAIFALFVCNCGDIDCWQCTVNIECYNDIVCWHNWDNPSRDWDYRLFPALSFDRPQYLHECEQALAFLNKPNPVER
ncbi:hypothetical protein [Aliivibrio kagoshimensis]|uniref:hypothetical protein n=1 Tax=Aliivibrio kagoshimensis TaxID=2910230 RepID=UPI003D0B140F